MILLKSEHGGKRKEMRQDDLMGPNHFSLRIMYKIIIYTYPVSLYAVKELNLSKTFSISALGILNSNSNQSPAKKQTFFSACVAPVIWLFLYFYLYSRSSLSSLGSSGNRLRGVDACLFVVLSQVFFIENYIDHQ